MWPLTLKPQLRPILPLRPRWAHTGGDFSMCKHVHKFPSIWNIFQLSFRFMAELSLALSMDIYGAPNPKSCTLKSPWMRGPTWARFSPQMQPLKCSLDGVTALFTRLDICKGWWEGGATMPERNMTWTSCGEGGIPVGFIIVIWKISHSQIAVQLIKQRDNSSVSCCIPTVY